MKAILFILSVLVSTSAYADKNVKCELKYLGDKDLFKVSEFSYMGIPSDTYLYTCANCGNIQINVYPSVQSQSSYLFDSKRDFENKIQAGYNRKDIANIEMENITQGGKVKYSLLETGPAEFFPLGQKITYLYFSAKQKDVSEPVGYSGFVTSNGDKSCSVIATYPGSELSPQGRKSLSYFMNHIAI